MIFGRHKSYGREVGFQVLNTLELASLGLRTSSSEKFPPSTELFMNSYVAGFVGGLVTASLAAAGGNKWSVTKKGEFAMNAYSVIDPSDTLRKILANELAVSSQDLFNEGRNDGTTYVLVISKKLKPDDNDPKLSMARDLVEFSGGLFDLPNAVLSVTLQRHLEKHWGEIQ